MGLEDAQTLPTPDTMTAQMSPRALRGICTLLFLLQACAQRTAVVSTSPSASLQVSDRAQRVFRDAIVIDTHNDMPSKMIDDGYNPDIRHTPGFDKTQGETDLPRLVESGITAVFLSAYVDPEKWTFGTDRSWKQVQVYLDSIHAFAKRHPDRLLLATTAAEVRSAKANGKVAVLIGVEGGHAIENSVENLRELARRGVRYMTLTWNNGNEWAGAAAGLNGTRSGGLTERGKEMIREMNRLGILVDISHVSDSTFYDAVAASSMPVIASHSSARVLNGHRRNMTDDMLRTVAKNGGVVNVNFYSAFVDPDFLRKADSIEKNVQGQANIDAATRALPRPSLKILLDHFDHIIKVAGVDHVGIGSDFDGVSGLLPQGMDDVTRLPLIAQGLLDRGYSEADVTKVLGGNMLRVMERAIDRR
jgi:membrane dipeptidase